MSLECRFADREHSPKLLHARLACEDCSDKHGESKTSRLRAFDAISCQQLLAPIACTDVLLRRRQKNSSSARTLKVPYPRPERTSKRFNSARNIIRPFKRAIPHPPQFSIAASVAVANHIEPKTVVRVKNLLPVTRMEGDLSPVQVTMNAASVSTPGLHRAPSATMPTIQPHDAAKPNNPPSLDHRISPL